jgi:hypothetical protein
MPLIKCHACEQEISDQAASCPHCGHPLQKQAGKKKSKSRSGKELIRGGSVLIRYVVGIDLGGTT